MKLFHRDFSNPEKAMGFFEHLEELRKRIFVAFGAVLLCSMLGFMYAREVIDFLMKPLRTAMKGMSIPAELHFTSLTEPLFQSFKIAFFVGISLAFPLWVWQAWKFIEPGLVPKEKKMAAPVLLSSTFLFVAGFAFAYVVAVPTAYRFLLMYAVPPNMQKQKQNPTLHFEFKKAKTSTKKAEIVLENQQGKNWKLHIQKIPDITDLKSTPQHQWTLQIQEGKKTTDWSIQMDLKGYNPTFTDLKPILTLKDYLSISYWFLFGFGLIFQTPLLIFLAVWMGLVSPSFLRKHRRHSFVLILIVAAVLTPTGDPVNLFIMAIPMYILYELGIFFASLVLGEETLETGVLQEEEIIDENETLKHTSSEAEEKTEFQSVHTSALFTSVMQDIEKEKAEMNQQENTTDTENSDNKTADEETAENETLPTLRPPEEEIFSQALKQAEKTRKENDKTVQEESSQEIPATPPAKKEENDK